MLLDASLVGRVIQDYRESKGLSQEVVSGLADIGRTHLSAIERGTRKPTLEKNYGKQSGNRNELETELYCPLSKRKKTARLLRWSAGLCLFTIYPPECI